VSGANVYLALGDSITAGYQVGLNNSFATFFSAFLSSYLPCLSYINLGTNGLTTGGLAGMLADNLQICNLVRSAKVISITIGSNDLLGFSINALQEGQVNFPVVLTRMANNFESIGQQVRFLNQNILVLVGNFYNPLPAGPFQGYAAIAQAVIDQANLLLLAWAKRFNFRLVQIDRLFRGKEVFMLGADHMHPGLSGHQAIAAEFMRNWLMCQRQDLSWSTRFPFLNRAQGLLYN
jgi:lysophospholipase L1-like esterase